MLLELRAFVPLPAAAAGAFLHLARDPQRAASAEAALDVAAVALAAYIPIYGRRTPGGPTERLSDEEVARGRFCEGATRLRFRGDVPDIEGLAVTREDLRQAIRRLDRAGVSFAHAGFEPVMPRIVPA